MVVAQESNVDYESLAYCEMKVRRALPRVLMGGTPTIREKGKAYLPQQPAEDDNHYAQRLKNAVLRNYYRRTVETLTGKIFSKPVVFHSVPEPLRRYLADNIDLTGRNLHSFARSAFRDALIDGISYVLVDFPPSQDGLSLAQEREKGNRPYCVQLESSKVIGWFTETVGEAEVLTEVRIREVYRRRSTENGLYGEDEITRVRILRPGMWEVWETNGEAGWSMVGSGKFSLNFIPLIPIYTSRTRFMEAEPPLEDLAYMNLEHYQIRSDQRNALAVASWPLFAATGYDRDKDGERLVVGPNKALSSSDPNTKFYFVESAGNHLAAGDRELKNLEADMRLFGLQFEVDKATAESATGRALDNAEGVAPLMAWALSLEDSLNTMLVYMGAWLGIDPQDVGTIEVNKDFGMSLKDQGEIEALLRSRQAGDISQETFLTELKRRGFFGDDFDVEVEMARISDEGPVGGDFSNRGVQGQGSLAPLVDAEAAASGNV